jgi:hypothetical protein
LVFLIGNNKLLNFNKFKIVGIASLIGVLNVLYSSSFIMSLIIIIFELLILLYHFVNKNITKYLGYYLIFLSLSYEYDYMFEGKKFYGFKNFRVLGVNLGIITLLPILFLFVLFIINNDINFIKLIKKYSSKLYYFINAFLFITYSAIFMGLFQLLVNDNNILSMPGVFKSFLGIIYYNGLFPILVIISFIYLLITEKNNINYLTDYLTAILIGLVISMIFSALTKTYGFYGGMNTLLVSQVIHFIPFMLLLSFYKKSKLFNLTFIAGILGAILTLFYNIKGKMIIIYLLLPFAIIVIFYKKKKLNYLLFLLIFLLITFLLFGNGFVEYFNENSNLFRSKLKQAISLIKFWDSEWVTNMPNSPKVRIMEFINIKNEYTIKPWYSLFGKGFMGSFKDHNYFFSSLQSKLGAFSIKQWEIGAFYRVHSSINIFFLYYGLSGLLFYFYMVKNIFLNFYRSPWLLIGGYWFLVLYGFSITITPFGMIALMLGLLHIDSKDFNL